VVLAGYGSYGCWQCEHLEPCEHPVVADTEPQLMICGGALLGMRACQGRGYHTNLVKYTQPSSSFRFAITACVHVFSTIPNRF
jgi:hypothetical protein